MDHEVQKNMVTKKIDNIVSDKNRIEAIKKNLIYQVDQREEEN